MSIYGVILLVQPKKDTTPYTFYDMKNSYQQFAISSSILHPLLFFTILCYGLCVLFFVAACSEQSVLSTPAPLPTMVSFTPLDELQARAGSRISTLVYALPEQQGVSLHDSLSFAQTLPISLTPVELRIWCDASCAGQLPSNTATVVLAQGVLDGPGSFGPQGIYRWQLKSSRLIAQTAEEMRLPALIQHMQELDMRLLRVSGTILLNKDSALLIDELGPGGIAAATAYQVKLRWLHTHDQILEQLQLLPGSDIHSGPVQIEGYMLNGRLVPLSVIALSQ